MGTFYWLQLSFRIVPSTRSVRQKVHLLDGIDRNDSLENSLCLTDCIGEKIITRINLQISHGEYIVKLVIIKVYTGKI